MRSITATIVTTLVTQCMAISLHASALSAQIRVNPTGVNINTQGATTVFLTFGGLSGYRAADAFWCGDVIPAAPAVGVRCNPSTVYGALPLRYDQSTTSGANGFTDIMTIPPSVSRRAYQAARDGQASAFFYVRRFVRAGSADQYVAVTCRLAGGGARTPLALTDVQVNFLPATPLLQVPQGGPMPAVEASVTYTGSGRLVGRWEIVLPGDELPAAEDLLTEATLPRERRGSQRRYQQLSRFNVFLSPSGRVVIPGPDPTRLPTQTDGVYYLLLRVEASADKEGDSNLSSAGADAGVVQSGGVAGFPMPTLRYVVGSGEGAPTEPDARTSLQLLLPQADDVVANAQRATLSWRPHPQATVYRIEFAGDTGAVRFSALVEATVADYRLPPFLRERLGGSVVRWRVVATDVLGRDIARSTWRSARWGSP